MRIQTLVQIFVTLAVFCVSPAQGRAESARLKRALAARGLLALPQASSFVAAHGRAPGAAPALSSLASRELENFFWRDGLLNSISQRTATPQQCSEFLASNSKASSAGLGACHQAEAVALGAATLADAYRPLCYLSKFPSKAIQAAVGYSVVSGQLPKGKISKLFMAPSGSEDRIVKLNFTHLPDELNEGDGPNVPKIVMLRLHSRARNNVARNSFGASLWFCAQSDSQAQGFHELEVSNSGKYRARYAQSRGSSDAEVLQVEAFVNAQAGGLAWDAARPRSLQISAARYRGSFKANLNFAPSALLRTKFFEIYDSAQRKHFALARYSGSAIDSLRLQSAAFSEVVDDAAYKGGFAYQASRYHGAALSAAQQRQLRSVSLKQDGFFKTAPETDVDASIYDCDFPPDVEINLDFENPTLLAGLAACNAALQDTRFCAEDDSVRSAQYAYAEACGE